MPDQDIERLLLLPLIRIHLSRASTETLAALERDLQTASRTGAYRDAPRPGESESGGWGTGCAVGEALKRVW
jgi:hypothetical protein